jgi:hypothetical protein
MIYVIILLGAHCASLATSLILTLLLAVTLASEGSQHELRIPEWVSKRGER